MSRTSNLHSGSAHTPGLILASGSPRRRELLAQIGIETIARAVDIDESRHEGEAVIDYVSRLAMEKAMRGHQVIENPGGVPVLGSDTVVELEGEILLKPLDRQDAAGMLRRLSGASHHVHTAVALVTGDRRSRALSTSVVTFAELAERDIARYLATGEADDKAGSYAIQGIAAQFISHIEGSYSGVMGLPLFETRRLLLECGIDPLTQYDAQECAKDKTQ